MIQYYITIPRHHRQASLFSRLRRKVANLVRNFPKRVYGALAAGLLACALLPGTVEAQPYIVKADTAGQTFDSGDWGLLVLGSRNVAGSTLCNTDGYFCTFTFDATGALRITGTIQATGDGAIQDGASPTVEATVRDYTNANPLAVVLTDTNGDYTAAGGGTQYATGTAVATPTGTAALGHDGANVRVLKTDAGGELQVDVLSVPTTTVTDGAGAMNVIVDSGTVTANAGTGTFATDPADEDTRVLGRAKIHDGTDTALVSGTGSLQVTCDNCGGATPFADDDVFTGGTTAVGIVGALYDTTPPAVTDGSAGAPRMNSSRALLVDGSGVTQPVSATDLDIRNLTATDTVTVTDGAGALNVIVDSGAVSVTGSVTANAGTDLNTSALLTTAAHDAALGVAGTADAQVRTVQGITGMTPVQVSQATASNLNATVTDGAGALNVIVDSGTTTVTQGTGTNLHTVVDSGTVSIDQTTTANDVDVTTLPSVTIGTFPDNEPFNLAQVAGATVATGNGTASGAIRVALPTDGTGVVGTVPATSGGTSISRTVAAGSTNATNVKASAGQVYQIIASNVNAAARFVHLYNTAGSPTCNTSIVATFILPGNATGAGSNITLFPGAAFGTGIAFCITTANDGTGAVTASDVVLNIFYK